jgi:hypothetical protein
MSRRRKGLVTLAVVVLLSASCRPVTEFEGFGADGKTLRVVNRTITKLDERNGVRLTAGPMGTGVAWVVGSDLRSGTIEVDVRGRENLGQLYLGIAFHRKDDDSYEAVHLRPFNFRQTDPVRRQHAVQYISMPQYDFDDLRRDFPEEFENPVDASLVPTDWVRLRLVIAGSSVQIFVGPVTQPTLVVRKLGQLDGGQVGLWVGNTSGGDFANLVVTPTR